MTRTNVLHFSRRSRRPSRPVRPIPLDTTTVGGLLQRTADEYPELLPLILGVAEATIRTRDVRSVNVGGSLVVFVSPPKRMAKAALTEWEQQQQA